MAKKVGARMKGLWVSAKKDFSENTQDLKQDFMGILEYAKRKRGPTPQGVSAGEVNEDVGAELLSHYKEEWAEIHSQIEQTSKAASKMDSDLQAIHNSVSQSHSVISRCHDEFDRLSETVAAVDEAQKRVEQLGKLLEEVEQSIIDCARVKAQLECERKKGSLRVQHERHCAEGDARVEQLKKILLDEKRISVEWKLEQENQEMVERQQAFQEIFDQQMADYRQSGHLDRPISERERSDSQLDEVVIEDEDGTTSLNEFLSDVVVEETGSPTNQDD